MNDFRSLVLQRMEKGGFGFRPEGRRGHNILSRPKGALDCTNKRLEAVPRGVR